MITFPNTSIENGEAASYLAQFEQAIRAVECNLLGQRDSEKVIIGLLKQAAEFYQADRTYIIEVECITATDIL